MVIREPISYELPSQLVEWQPSNAAVVSCYVDWSVSGRGLHEEETVVRHRLRELQRDWLDPRGAAHQSLSADAERIERYLEVEVPSSTQSLALFSCTDRGLWQVISLGVPMRTEVHAGSYPVLLPLFEATQDSMPALVVLADTNHARFIELGPFGASETAGPKRDVTTVQHSTEGGWGAEGYQRFIDSEIERFAREVSAAIGSTMREHGLQHLVLYGADPMLQPLQAVLTEAVAARLTLTGHMDMRAEMHNVADAAAGEIAAVVSTHRTAEAAYILGRAAGGHDAVSGERTIESLSAGRVDAVALDPEVLPPECVELALREAFRAWITRRLVSREQWAARRGRPGRDVALALGRNSCGKDTSCGIRGTGAAAGPGARARGRQTNLPAVLGSPASGLRRPVVHRLRLRIQCAAR